MKRLLLIIILFGFAGCNQKKVSCDFYQKPLNESVSACASPERVNGSGYAQPSPLVVNSPSCKTINVQKQMLIKRASIRFEVKSYEKARQNINTIIKYYNAYIVSERESKSYDQLSNTISIRTPELIFDDLIDSVVSQAKNLDTRSITVDDVTEEYVDTDARLKAKKEIEKRYLEILKLAQTIKDILEVEQKLGGIREEIESAEGRLKYLSHQVAFSTIDLTYYEQKTVPPEHRTGWLSRSSTAFVNGWDGLSEFIIGLISIWPFLCFIAATVIIILRIIISKRKRDAKKAEL
jgi:hypothetical protein